MPAYSPQVLPKHYSKPSYLTSERWASYWHQIDLVRSCSPQSVLEIGVGNGIVQNALTSLGYKVQTVDIDPALKPTQVASVTKLPYPDKSFDLILCAEVLEHLPYEDSLIAMKEIRRVASKGAIITLPNSGYTLSLILKLPLLPWLKLGTKLPHFWKTHVFNGQHYWETGKRGWSRKKIRLELERQGFKILNEKIFSDDPSHVAFVCR